MFPPESIIGRNLENLIEDFQIMCSEGPLRGMPQSIIDLAFTTFLFGVTNIMDPGASFNKKFVEKKSGV